MKHSLEPSEKSWLNSVIRDIQAAWSQFNAEIHVSLYRRTLQELAATHSPEVIANGVREAIRNERYLPEVVKLTEYVQKAQPPNAARRCPLCVAGHGFLAVLEDGRRVPIDSIDALEKRKCVSSCKHEREAQVG